MEGVAEGQKTSAFFQALERGRDDFNARFLRARRGGLRVDGEIFSEVMRDLAGPIVDAVAIVDAGAVEETTEVVFDVGLRLSSHFLLGRESRHGAINSLWREDLPRLSRFVARDPRRVISALSNAAHFMALARGGDVQGWRELLAEVAPRCHSVDELLQMGQVLAWRSGMAHFRESALKVWEGLGEELKYAALGASREMGSVDELRHRVYQRWMPLDSDEPEVASPILRVGGFRGDGGPFLQPPRVCLLDGRIFACDQRGVWSIHADIFGACCQRAPVSVREFSRVYDGKAGVIKDEIRKMNRAFDDATSVAVTLDTTAISLGHSHFIYLIAGGARNA